MKNDLIIIPYIILYTSCTLYIIFGYPTISLVRVEGLSRFDGIYVMARSAPLASSRPQPLALAHGTSHSVRRRHTVTWSW